MDIIPINIIQNKTYKVLSGKELGEKARAYFNLDLLDSQANIVKFTVPEEVFSINSSFFSAMFQKSIKTLGIDRFREQYIFDCDEIIRMNIENGIFNITGTSDILGGQS